MARADKKLGAITSVMSHMFTLTGDAGDETERNSKHTLTRHHDGKRGADMCGHTYNETACATDNARA